VTPTFGGSVAAGRGQRRLACSPAVRAQPNRAGKPAVPVDGRPVGWSADQRDRAPSRPLPHKL